jgi:quaternary ammonium compound-resistance protein SugE
MAWIILVVAGLFEIGWAIGLKYTEGFTKLWPSVLTLGAMAVSMYLLGVASKTLPIGTAYAVWVGIGAAGTAILGIFLFGEAASVARVVCLVLLSGDAPGSLLDPTTMQWRWPAGLEAEPDLLHQLQRLLSRHPDERFASAGQALVAFQSLAMPDSTGPVPRADRTSSPPRSSMGISLPVGQVGSIVVVGATT